MRVALLTNFIPPYRVPLFQALAGIVGELRIFTSTKMEAGRPWSAEWGGLDVVVQTALTIPRTYRGPGYRQRVELHIPLDTIRLLREYRPDVVVSGEFGARTILALRYATVHGVPFAVWATLCDHLERHRGRIRTILRRWILRHPLLVFTNGQDGARYLRRLGFPDEHIALLPQTTDLAPFLAVPLERPRSASLRVLFVGSLSERKAPNLLLRAGARVASSARPIALTFVGDGPLRGELQAHAAASPHLHVRFVGSIPYNDLPRWYAEADVLAFPTLADEWGLVVNEALAAGVPVLGSLWSQAVEELVRDGVNGWVFTPSSVDAMASALSRVLAVGDAELAAMRVAARDSIRSLTPERVAETLARELERMLNASRRAVNRLEHASIRQPSGNPPSTGTDAHA